MVGNEGLGEEEGGAEGGGSGGGSKKGLVILCREMKPVICDIHYLNLKYFSRLLFVFKLKVISSLILLVLHRSVFVLRAQGDHHSVLLRPLCSALPLRPVLLWISSNLFSLNLLLVRSHQAEIIIVKCLIQGHNNVTGLRVEP